MVLHGCLCGEELGSCQGREKFTSSFCVKGSLGCKRAHVSERGNTRQTSKAGSRHEEWVILTLFLNEPGERVPKGETANPFESELSSGCHCPLHPPLACVTVLSTPTVTAHPGVSFSRLKLEH